MQPKSQRRVHGAEFKAQVLAECEQPGASVAAVALAHGLNVNLVRKWLVGRGLKRAGLSAPRTVAQSSGSVGQQQSAALHFVPVGLAASPIAADPATKASPPAEPDIHVELTRGDAQLCVRWPSAQAESCAAWLRELTTSALAP